MFYEEASNLSKEYRQNPLSNQPIQGKRGQRLSIGTLPILSQYPSHSHARRICRQPSLIHVFLEELRNTTCCKDFPTTPMTSSSPAATCWTVKPIPSFHWQKTGWLQSCLKTTDRQTGSRISLSDIAGEGFILMHSYTSIYHFCMDLFQKAGIRLHLLRTARMESIISAVAVHEGISLLPEKISGCSNIKTLSLFP